MGSDLETWGVGFYEIQYSPSRETNKTSSFSDPHWYLGDALVRLGAEHPLAGLQCLGTLRTFVILEVKRLGRPSTECQASLGAKTETGEALPS